MIWAIMGLFFLPGIYEVLLGFDYLSRLRLGDMIREFGVKGLYWAMSIVYFVVIWIWLIINFILNV